MKPSEIQRWATQVIERVQRRQPFEDQQVELKREFPDPRRAARRIAALCNAARMDNAMWIIGVAEDGTVYDAPEVELANWWPEVLRHFDQQKPPYVPVAVPWGDKVAMAVWFDASFAPYVFIDQNGNREVPWRDGTGTRSAKRHELLNTLSRSAPPPEVEIMEARLDHNASDVWNEGTASWYVEGGLYITPSDDRVVVFPLHTVEVTVSATDGELPFSVRRLSPDGSGRQFQDGPTSFTIQGSPSEIVVRGPGLVWLRAVCPSEGRNAPAPRPTVRVSMRTAPGRLFARATATLAQQDPKGTVWEFSRW